MANYIALIHRGPNGGYFASFPDLPGCASGGSTLDEAHATAAEALALHIDEMIMDGEALPEPSSLDRVMQNRGARDAVAILFTVEVKVRAVRVNITLPEDTLREIDRHAEAHGLTRSGFLAQAARRAMAEG